MRWRRVTLAAVFLGFWAVAGCGNGEPVPSTPHNVIVFVADGVGFNTLDAASLWEWGISRYRIAGEPGEVRLLDQGAPAAWSFQEFPVRLAMSTHTAVGSYDPEVEWSDFRATVGEEGVPETVTGSAAGGTAISTGVKTIDPALGLDPDGGRLVHLLEWAQGMGKAGGVVTNVPFNHATPAAFVAHNASRNNYHEIAREMLLEVQPNVVMGTGHPFFDDDSRRLDSPRFFWLPEDLWEDVVEGRTPYTLVEEREGFTALAAGPTPSHVLGLARAFNATTFNREPTPLRRSFREGPPGRVDPDELPFETPSSPEVPSLAEMTAGALNVLANASPEGFFLMVEAGAADWGGHWNILGRTIEDVMELVGAVDVALDWVEAHSSWDETLVVVLSDHESGHLSGAGSGPGWEPLEPRGVGELPGHQWHHTYHTNQLVPFYARGAGALELPELARDRMDPVRGPWIDNTDLARWLFRRWGREGGEAP